MANIFEEVWSQFRLINRGGGEEDGREKVMVAMHYITRVFFP